MSTSYVAEHRLIVGEMHFGHHMYAKPGYFASANCYFSKRIRGSSPLGYVLNHAAGGADGGGSSLLLGLGRRRSALCGGDSQDLGLVLGRSRLGPRRVESPAPNR